MLKKWMMGLSAICGLFLVGCAGYSVKYDYDSRAAYSTYKRFDWYAASRADKEKAKGVADPIMDRRVKYAVEKELAAKGFRREEKGDPDFLVTYYPIYNDRHVHTSTSVGTRWGYRPFGVGMGTTFSQTYTYREGTIVIEVIDFKTNQLIWKAAAEGALTDINSPEDADEVVTQAVRQMLEKFPPHKP
jgi:Domain of unknown function (DUF4136)